jgi:RimJ/RimL family protein N-acetyltransferase
MIKNENSYKLGELELSLFEPKELKMAIMTTTIRRNCVYLCRGEVKLRGKLIGRLGHVYQHGDKTYFQKFELDKEYWNKGYLTRVCEFLIEKVKMKGSKYLVLENIQTFNDEAKHEGNIKKAERLGEKLTQKGLINKAELKLNPDKEHYDMYFLI